MNKSLERNKGRAERRTKGRENTDVNHVMTLEESNCEGKPETTQ